MTVQFHDHVLPDAALAQLFTEARSYSRWLDREVSDDQLRAIWALATMAPTSANMQPVRIVWAKSPQAKAKLAECVMEGNRTKVLTAPVTAVIGFDIDFHEELPWLFPHTDAKSWFDGDEAARAEHALRNSALQGAYVMLAARALGLDCGPMSGFDPQAVNATFFADAPRHRANFICAIGYGDPAGLHPRGPRPDFDRFHRIV
jgi:3-hydroxypropanoate dehydrogenase